MPLDAPLHIPKITFAWSGVKKTQQACNSNTSGHQLHDHLLIHRYIFLPVMMNFKLILQNQAVAQPGANKPSTSKEMGNPDNQQAGKKVFYGILP